MASTSTPPLEPKSLEVGGPENRNRVLKAIVGGVRCDSYCAAGPVVEAALRRGLLLLGGWSVLGEVDQLARVWVAIWGLMLVGLMQWIVVVTR
jgi:hypothetical protein